MCKKFLHIFKNICIFKNKNNYINIIDKQTYLITGGAGFIGSCHVLQSRKQGCRIINLDKLIYAGNMDNLIPRFYSKYVDLITYVTDRSGHDFRYAVNSSRIKNEHCWAQKNSFEEGTLETVRWYLENPDWRLPARSGAYQDRLQKNYSAR